MINIIHTLTSAVADAVSGAIATAVVGWILDKIVSALSDAYTAQKKLMY